MCLYGQIDEVDMVSPMSLKKFVSLAVVELGSFESATNGATLSSYNLHLDSH